MIARGGRSPPRAPWHWALTGVVLGALVLLAFAAPARWLVSGLAWASGERVLLSDAQGSVWGGSALLVLAGGADSHDRAALPGRVHWRLVPVALGVDVRIRADCCTPQEPLELRARPGWGGFRIDVADGQSLWPAALLAGLGTPLNTIQPQGELALTTRALGFQRTAGRWIVNGGLEVTARQLSSRLSTLRPMGSYRLELRGGEDIRVTLTTLEGGLRLSGSGQWVGTRLRFRGEASTAPGLEAQLANLLNILGRREGDRAIMSFG